MSLNEVFNGIDMDVNDTESYDDKTSNEGSDADNESIREYPDSFMSDDDRLALQSMVVFSFSSQISEDAVLITALEQTFERFSEFCYQNQNNIDDIRMKTVLSIASQAYGQNIDKINRAREERLCFEATCLLLFSRRDYLSHEFLLTEDEFISYYPEYTPALIGQSEFYALLKFRNLMKMAMHLIPPLHNKNHLLDLVTRLVEGKGVRHVTGTGATKATKARVSIILKEGNLVVPKRPPRGYIPVPTKQTKSSSQSRKKYYRKYREVTEVPRSRGRPRKDSLSSEDISVRSHSISSNQNSVALMADPFNLQTKRPRLSPPPRNESSEFFYEAFGKTEGADIPFIPTAISSGLSNQNLETTNDCFNGYYDCDLPLAPVELIRCQSIEWWSQTVAANGAESLLIQPDFLRASSFFNAATDN